MTTEIQDKKFIKYSQLPEHIEFDEKSGQVKAYFFNLLVIPWSDFIAFLERTHSARYEQRILPIIIAVIELEEIFRSSKSHHEHNRIFEEGAIALCLDEKSHTFDLVCDNYIKFYKQNLESFIEVNPGLFIPRDPYPSGG